MNDASGAAGSPKVSRIGARPVAQRAGDFPSWWHGCGVGIPACAVALHDQQAASALVPHVGLAWLGILGQRVPDKPQDPLSLGLADTGQLVTRRPRTRPRSGSLRVASPGARAPTR